jgi:hypothetical protein
MHDCSLLDDAKLIHGIQAAARIRDEGCQLELYTHMIQTSLTLSTVNGQPNIYCCYMMETRA